METEEVSGATPPHGRRRVHFSTECSSFSFPSPLNDGQILSSVSGDWSILIPVTSYVFIPNANQSEKMNAQIYN